MCCFYCICSKITDHGIMGLLFHVKTLWHIPSEISSCNNRASKSYCASARLIRVYIFLRISNIYIFIICRVFLCWKLCLWLNLRLTFCLFEHIQIMILIISKPMESVSYACAYVKIGAEWRFAVSWFLFWSIICLFWLQLAKTPVT